MNTINTPVHSTASLIKASLVAAFIAVVVLVICILPSEYNIDPTGLGETLGLTKLAQPQSKKTTAIEAAKRSDTVNIEVPAG